MASYYVDPSIAGNSGTGTIGDPYGDLQYALDSITQGASGDQINIKSGTDEVLTAELSIATYGTPNVTKPIVFRGYSTAENDGGRGGISLNDSVASMWYKLSVEGVQFIDLDIHDQASVGSYVIGVDRACFVWRCKFTNIDGYALTLPSTAGVSLCLESAFISNSTRGTGVGGASGAYIGNYFKGGGSSGSVFQTVGGIIIGNVFYDGDYAITGDAYRSIVIGNTCIAKSASTGQAIVGSYGTIIANNIIQGWSGTGGDALDGLGSSFINNLIYDCTNNIDPTASLIITDEDTTTASGSLIEDASDENFAAASEAQGVGIPDGQMFGTEEGGNTGTDLALNVGAAQNKASGGGIQIARGQFGGMRG